ncbi:hypothetical protein ACQZ40_23995 [Agrobacterium sp. 16-172Ci]|uniref:Uncharacterized protein n=1 Tax=Agrobacterium tumefaciens TaxID=358 RepID=A0A2L2LH57_AGRTU|nr:hypothetical protein [Agrobacterium tumefaciens]AVH43662.1 hypothetical protein At1D1609_36090 [Agrobacterium tumefaciens]NSY97607.1 hypothetical protein [Agrobacterium tumefaciens]
MEYALYNGTDRRVTADEFHQLAGPNFREQGILPYCEQCQEAVDPHGVHNPGIPSCFHHPNFPIGADPYDDCPAARRQARRFVGVTPRGFDEAHGQALRDQFFAEPNIRLAYQFMHRVAGGPGQLPVELFGRIIERADRRRIWAYSDLPLWCVPFILMTLAQFEAPNFSFHFGFVKPRGPAEMIWEHERTSELVKYFSDSGRETRAPRLMVTEETFIHQAEGTGVWVADALAARLQQFHGHIG